MGGQFANNDFITFCENLDIRICTTAAERPWSNIGSLNYIIQYWV